jgi:hypothetical protein
LEQTRNAALRFENPQVIAVERQQIVWLQDEAKFPERERPPTAAASN